jgi:hypothetical protein
MVHGPWVVTHAVSRTHSLYHHSYMVSYLKLNLW